MNPRIALVSVLGAATVSSLSAASITHASSLRCEAPRGASVLRHSRSAVLFEVVSPDDTGRTYYGCDQSQRVVRRLLRTRTSPTYVDDLRMVRLAGSFFVAVRQFGDQYGTGGSDVVYRNLRSRRPTASEALSRYDAGLPRRGSVSEEKGGNSAVVSLRAQPGGVFAYSEEITAPGTGARRGAVTLHDRRGSRRLALSADVDPRSLRLGQRQVSWLEAGRRRVAAVR